MPLYKYIAKSSEGRTIESTMDAPNEGEVVSELRGKGLLIVEVTKAKGAKKQSSHKKISLDDLVTFTRQMATMIDAGLPLLQSLRIMEEQLDNINFRSIMGQVGNDIESGASFSEALQKHPKAFDNLYCSMIKVGEASGMFAEILTKVANYMEEAAKLRRKVKSAMVYPAVVSGMALVITTALLMKVVPIFEEIFSGFGSDLPAPTKFIVAVSDLLRENFLLGVLLIIGLVILFKWMNKIPACRYQFDKYQFKMPVFGDIFEKNSFVSFHQNFGNFDRQWSSGGAKHGNCHHDLRQFNNRICLARGHQKNHAG